MPDNIKYKAKNHRVFSCQYHIVICTKYRKKIFVCGIDKRLKEIILETAKMYKFEIPDIEVMPDHVRMIIDCDPEKGIVDCIRNIKSRSSHILYKEYPALKKELSSIWSRGYFVSSVGSVSLEVVKKYIEEQNKE